MIPNVLTIAGSDSSGGAGIQADLKTFTAFGVYGASVVTALTAQNTKGVQSIHWVPGDFVAAQLGATLSDLDFAAIKIGMAGRVDAVAAIADALAAGVSPAIVLDPVMVATSGDPLLEADAEAALKSQLIPRAGLITPNIHEAARLLGAAPAADAAAMQEQAVGLRDLGVDAVLLTGGDLEGSQSVDVLADAIGVEHYAATRIATRDTHGTGCTLSSAVAANLALGRDLRAAIAEAKAFVSDALASADALSVGAGRGPLNHLARRAGKTSN